MISAAQKLQDDNVNEDDDKGNADVKIWGYFVDHTQLGARQTCDSSECGT